MKVTSLQIINIRLITDATIQFNKPLILLYGDVEQGKTTFLDAIKILFKKGFPNDLIQHEKDEAEITLTLENGIISRSFYTAENGAIKGRPLRAIVNNRSLSISELQTMFNPFQLNQDFLKDMNAPERKRFFVDLFGIDTKTIDDEIKDAETISKDLKSEIKGFGEIEVIEVDEPDMVGLLKERKVEKERLLLLYRTAVRDNVKLKYEWENDCHDARAVWSNENTKHLQGIQSFNKEQGVIKTKLKNAKKQLSTLMEFENNVLFSECINFELATRNVTNMDEPEDEKPITQLSDPELPKEPTYSDPVQDKAKHEEIQLRVNNAGVQQLRYETYLKDVQKGQLKISKELELKEALTRIYVLRKRKVSNLSEYGEEIPGLSFNEDGELNFEGAANENLSTSQVVRLGSLLSKLFPDSLLDLELLDRAESLGKKIWEFEEKAKNENKTILAAIVGERPAVHPEDVGVFVVENGNISE